MSAIHQFVAGFTNGDAISNEAVVMRDIFRSWGYKSEIFSEIKRILPELRKEARDVTEYKSECSKDDIVLLHLSIGSDVNDIFRALDCKKAILYHNVTPSHYLELINRKMAYDLAKGRKQIESLSGVAQINMADSAFNARELSEIGYKDVKVLPLILNLEKLKASPDRKILRKYDDGVTNVIFVGRCVPNKKIEDALKAFVYFHKFVEPNSRFIHVGSFAGTEQYYYILKTQAKDIGIDAVHFAGSVPQSHLNAFYQCADIFLCMSEHEGFCIPVVESLVHDVPVLAYDSCAVPETLDGAGVLFKEKDFGAIAEMMGELAHNNELRSAVITKQRERLEQYKKRNLEDELKQHLEPLMS